MKRIDGENRNGKKNIFNETQIEWNVFAAIFFLFSYKTCKMISHFSCLFVLMRITSNAIKRNRTHTHTHLLVEIKRNHMIRLLQTYIIRACNPLMCVLDTRSLVEIIPFSPMDGKWFAWSLSLDFESSWFVHCTLSLCLVQLKRAYEDKKKQMKLISTWRVNRKSPKKLLLVRGVKRRKSMKRRKIDR